MVFQTEASFQQFIHSKFRENTIRLLHIPWPRRDGEGDKVLLTVNKQGGVGLYDPEKLTILHTYLLDLSVPMKADRSHEVEQIGRHQLAPPPHLHRPPPPPPPKCQRTHLVADAIYAEDVNAVVFATTKNILQVYDLGDIEKLSFGLEIFPRQKLLKLRAGQSPVVPRNRGHVETHRIFGLADAGTFHCLEYVSPRTLPSSLAEGLSPKLIIGDKTGIITIISIPEPTKPFGKRKARGVLHKIMAMDLQGQGLLEKYQAHHSTIRQIHWVPSRQLIISCSDDEKFSLFIKDYTETTEPYIVSLQKGVNTFAHNDSLRLIATGSDDCIVRLFNQYVMKMPQMELVAHKSPIIGLEFLQLPFSDKPLLISYATDTEIRAWDPVDFVCLQSLHVSFPIHSQITASKTPEFGKKPLIIHQLHYDKQRAATTFDETEHPRGEPTENELKTSTKSRIPPQSTYPPKGEDGFIILLYCNAYARLTIEKDTTHWPFDFDDFVNDFEDATTTYERKVRDRQAAYAQSKYSSKDPNVLKLSPEELVGIEAKLDSYVRDIIKIKRHADKQLRSAIYDPNKPSLAGETTRKFLQLESHSARYSDLLRKEGIRSVFKFVPLYNLQPVEFNTIKSSSLSCGHVKDKGNKTPAQLPVTSIMRDAGITQITSASDLLSPTAKRFFTGERFKSAQFEAKITARTAQEKYEQWLDSSEQLKAHQQSFSSSMTHSAGGVQEEEEVCDKYVHITKSDDDDD